MATKNDNVPSTIVGNVPESLLSLVAQNPVGDSSLETMKHHRVLNRISLIQGMTAKEMKQKFGEGSIVIPASDVCLAKLGEKFDFVPVMFFDEFVTWNDRADKSQPSKIFERSYDRASLIAVKAGDPNRRAEQYGEEQTGPNGKFYFKRKHTHHLNFLIMIYSGQFKGTMCALSFSRSEFKKGLSFISAIKMRKITNGAHSVQAPLWATVWSITPGDRKNDKGEWYGYDISPAEKPFIDNADVMPFKTIHEELMKEYKDRAISVGHEAAEMGEDSAADETEM